MRKILFIDRDGTIIKEPEDEQIDSLEKLEFITGVIRSLYQLTQQMDYELVMVSNQDGLGTDSYGMESFDLVQNRLLNTLKGEHIEFSEILIDRSFPNENLPTRKPGIGMVDKYLNETLDYENSFVIGDRMSDIQLAQNMGIKGILLSENEIKKSPVIDQKRYFECLNWDEIVGIIRSNNRSANIIRKTYETQIELNISLDGKGKSEISTGLKFFDHMLEQIARHGDIELRIKVDGDLGVDEHHTIEDTAICLGEAFRKALGNKKGIERYGFTLPMDDCLSQVAIDFGGRPWLVWDATFNREKIGDMPSEMFYHFFKSFSDAALCNLNIKAEGVNEHHKIESIFKAFAKTLRMAIKQDFSSTKVPSTKGIL